MFTPALRCTASNIVVAVLACRVSATGFHVTANGAAHGTGAVATPWDLATALNSADAVAPGDTIWLHGGTYRGGFTSRLMSIQRADARRSPAETSKQPVQPVQRTSTMPASLTAPFTTLPDAVRT